jgi:t-SNARE complex subunit (syntaxin)
MAVDNQRSLWAQTRASISEYERQACELQLDLQQEVKELQSAKDSLAGIKKGELRRR